jgi:oligopeptide/dipeptide ABC transporter ATP-binding protein
MRSIRGGKIAMIFQEPMTSLNPAMTIARQLSEQMELHLHLDNEASRKRSIELLKLVGIPDAEGRIDDYPHQFSGGMRQRVMVAMAVSCNPKLLIADEPTTALDATIQAQLLELMKDIVVRFQTAMVMVTHNLGIVARYANRINVMYAGRIVESGTVKEIWDNPLHPYTIGLLQCVPKLGQRLAPIEGAPPHLINMAPTCPFLPRCRYAQGDCAKEAWGQLRYIEGQHYVTCPVDTRKVRPRKIEVLAARTVESTAQNEVVLDVKDLRMYFPVTRGLFRRKVADVKRSTT